MPFLTKIIGTRDIKDKSIKDAQIADDAAIQETKLALDYTTQNLHDNSLRIDEDREVQDGIKIIVPELYIKDKENGKIYKITSHNGVLVLEEQP